MILTDDLAKTKAFYLDRLGCTSRFDLPNYLQVQFRDEDGPELCFMLPSVAPELGIEPKAFDGAGVVVSIPVDDVDETYARYSKRDVPIVSPPKDRPWQWRSFVCRDRTASCWISSGRSRKLPQGMRRADRLFRIVSLLRGRRSVTAAQLAERLQVSERTIYRDVADLVASGVGIQGEAGVGYRLDKGFDLPSLMFNVREVQALVLGARMVQAWADDELRAAASAALDEIEAVLPAERKGSIQQTALFSIGFVVPDIVRKRFAIFRGAIEARKKVAVVYEAPDKPATRRTIRPLGLYFWGGTWTVGAYCELRQDHRSFRLDRMENVRVTDDVFELVSPVTLADFVKAAKG